MSRELTSGGRRDLREWHRDFEERKIAGVCAGLAHQLELPLTALRAVFLLLALFPGFHGVGVALYLIFWFLMPAKPGAPSGLDRLLGAARSLTGREQPEAPAAEEEPRREPES